ncbi:MAG: hypothetical protein CL503_03590 [Actinobacteria bacterium]|nr:hypothetical protein [Actinomycetota bacterium]
MIILRFFMKNIGYLKGFRQDESIDFQKRELKKAGCSIIFKDIVSSSKELRSGFVTLLDRLEMGDRVVVYNFAKLGSSLSQLVDHVVAIQDRGAHLYFVEESIETTMMMSFSDIFQVLKQGKVSIDQERTAPGRQGAKVRGLLGGRPEKITDRQTQEIKRLYKEDIPIKSICERLKISRPTLYKYLKR